jgi:hypothetical protein
VGLPKAGSTAFQDWCNTSSSILSDYGVYYAGIESENGAFLTSYLSSPSLESLAKVINQLNIFASEAQSRGLETLLLSSEQIFEFVHSFEKLSTSLLANLEIIKKLSVLMICRDPQEVAKSSWKQAILASGEKRSLDEYSPWLAQLLNANIQTLAVSNQFNLINYPYAIPLNFIDIVKAISCEKELAYSSEKTANILEGSHSLLNQTLPDSCYRFWLSSNRAYSYRAHQISFIRLEILQTRSTLRKHLLKCDSPLKRQKILTAIESLAISKFFEQSAVERAVSLVSQFMNDISKEQQQVALEFLLINQDYLYEPMFNKSHADEIISEIAGNTGRTMRLMDVLRGS